MTVLGQLQGVLNARSIPFRLVIHEPVGETIKASELRGHPLHESAKSLLLRARLSNARRFYVLAVLPGDRRLDLRMLADQISAKRVGFAAPGELMEITGCVPGSVPPIQLNDRYEVITDAALNNADKIIFNAGRLDTSIEMATSDYMNKLATRIVPLTIGEPQLHLVQTPERVDIRGIVGGFEYYAARPAATG